MSFPFLTAITLSVNVFFFYITSLFTFVVALKALKYFTHMRRKLHKLTRSINKKKNTSLHAQPSNVNACWSRLSCAAYHYHKKQRRQQRCRQQRQHQRTYNTTLYNQRCSTTSQFADVGPKRNCRSGTKYRKKARQISWSFVHPCTQITNFVCV